MFTTYKCFGKDDYNKLVRFKELEGGQDILNEATEITEKIIRLMVTPLCRRDCEFCCNKQYSIADVPTVSDEELQRAEVLCLTGGEPFVFTDPCNIAQYYRRIYRNIRKVYVYTNAFELADWIDDGNRIHDINGLSISIKTESDAFFFQKYIENEPDICSLPSNRLYVFHGLYTGKPKGFEVIHREWPEVFKPANDSIFRRL